MHKHKNPGLSQRLLPAASLQACIAPKMLAQDACDQQQMQWHDVLYDSCQKYLLLHFTSVWCCR